MLNLQTGIRPGTAVINDIIRKESLVRQGHLRPHGLYGRSLAYPVSQHKTTQTGFLIRICHHDPGKIMFPTRFIQKGNFDHETSLFPGRLAARPRKATGYLVSHQGMEQGVEPLAEFAVRKKNRAQQRPVDALIRQKKSLAESRAHGQPPGSPRFKKLTAESIGAKPPGPADLTQIGCHGTLARAHAPGNGNHRCEHLLHHCRTPAKNSNTMLNQATETAMTGKRPLFPASA